MNDKVKIINQSKRRIVRLKLLSKFFQQIALVNICIKTEIIHTVFKDNIDGELDVNQLELFHLQYTDSLLELLQKIKKKKESEIVVILNEIDVNTSFIEKYQNQDVAVGDFDLERKFHSSMLSIYLKNVYHQLAQNSFEEIDEPIKLFADKFANDYFRKEVDEELLKGKDQLKFYEFPQGKIERKLLGKLNIQAFKVRFLCGYKVNNQCYELVRLFNTDEEFIWNIEANEFYLLEEEELQQLDRNKNTKTTNSISETLMLKNKELKMTKNRIKTDFPEEIITILEAYQESIENTDVLNQVFNVDEQTNILKAMLKLNLNNN